MLVMTRRSADDILGSMSKGDGEIAAADAADVEDGGAAADAEGVEGDGAAAEAEGDGGDGAAADAEGDVADGAVAEAVGSEGDGLVRGVRKMSSLSASSLDKSRGTDRQDLV